MPNAEAGEVSTPAWADVETNLDILDLGSVFQALSSSRRTGTLKITRHGGEEIYIYLKKGLLRLVSSTSPDRGLLDEALLQTKKLTPEGLAELRIAADAAGKPLVKLLMSEDRFSKGDLQGLLAGQVVDRVADVLSWKEINCNFFPDQLVVPELDPDLEEIAGAVPVDGVLLEAARRADEWERIHQAFDSVGEVFELVRELPAHLTSQTERDIAALVDGVRDVSEIAELSSLNKFEVCAALFGLFGRNYIHAKRPGQLIDLGGQAAERGDWAKALKLYRRAQDLDRKRSDLPVKIAEAYQALGNTVEACRHLAEYAKESMAASRFMEAERACERLVELAPGEIDYRARLFRCLLENGERTRAAEIGRGLAIDFEKRGVLDRAAEVLAKVRDILPDDSQLAEMDARIRLATAERTEALVEYEKLADSYLERGEIGDAIRTFRKILDEIDEECLEARLQLAECLTQVDRVDEAVAEYSKLAEILMRTGVFAESVNLPFVVNVQRKVAELAPDNTSSREWLAETYAARGDRASALAQYDELLAIYAATGTGRKVTDTLARVAELFPDELAYRERLAEHYLREDGGREKARSELQALCRAAWQEGNLDMGVRAAESLLNIDPFYMEGHVLLGEALLARGETEAGMEKMLSVALMYMGAGLLAEAEEVLKEILAHQDDHFEAHRFLAAVLEERESHKEAAGHYKWAGLLAEARQDLGTARSCLEFAVELNPEDRGSREALERLVTRTGAG